MRRSPHRAAYSDSHESGILLASMLRHTLSKRNSPQTTRVSAAKQTFYLMCICSSFQAAMYFVESAKNIRTLKTDALPSCSHPMLGNDVYPPSYRIQTKLASKDCSSVLVLELVFVQLCFLLKCHPTILVGPPALAKISPPSCVTESTLQDRELLRGAPSRSQKRSTVDRPFERDDVGCETAICVAHQGKLSTAFPGAARRRNGRTSRTRPRRVEITHSAGAVAWAYIHRIGYRPWKTIDRPQGPLDHHRSWIITRLLTAAEAEWRPRISSPYTTASVTDLTSLAVIFPSVRRTSRSPVSTKSCKNDCVATMLVYWWSSTPAVFGKSLNWIVYVGLQ